MWRAGRVVVRPAFMGGGSWEGGAAGAGSEMFDTPCLAREGGDNVGKGELKIPQTESLDPSAREGHA